MISSFIPKKLVAHMLPVQIPDKAYLEHKIGFVLMLR